MTAVDTAWVDRLQLEQIRPGRITHRGRIVRGVAYTVGGAAMFAAGMLVPGAGADPCPAGTVLRTFEDGSGGCYAPGQRMPVRDSAGFSVQWPEGTFPWDCTRQGNRRCGR